MKTQRINIHDKYSETKWREVEATVIGLLAVHRCSTYITCRDAHWSISHVPTGWRVKGCIKNRAQAIRIAEALQSLDWNFRSPKSRKVKAMESKVKQAIDLTV